MEPIVLETAHRLVRLAATNDHGVDLAGLQFLQCDACSIYTTFGFIPSRSNTVSGGDEGAAIGEVDANGLAIEIPEIADRFRRDDMHLFIVELGHIGELFS